MSGLQISRNLELPLGYMTDSGAILAKRGAGKTYAGLVLAEQMMGVGSQLVAIDPTGVWWGLRSSADGKSEGLPITILGGEHGDIPLESTAGEVVADLVVDTGQSFVLDLSMFNTKAEQVRFCTAFGERLYRAKSARDARTPLHLFLDEADQVAPQKPDKGELKMLGAWETIVRLGRSRGLGVTMITQRPAVLNKNVLTQIECLLVLRITSPNDRVAVRDWLEGHGSREERGIVLDSLASLDQGEAWVWYPQEYPEPQRIQVRRRTTYDSSRTPGSGKAVAEPRKVAPVDLVALQEAMAETIERAEQTDPVRLRKQITDLQRQLAQVGKGETVERVVEVAVPRVPDEIRTLPDRVDEVLRRMLEGAADEISTTVREVVQARVDAAIAEPLAAPARQDPRPTREKVADSFTDAPVNPAGLSADGLGKAATVILTVLVQFPEGRTRKQVGMQSGYVPSRSTFRNALSTLRQRGLIEDLNGNTSLRATQAGLDLLGGRVPEIPQGDALYDYWRGELDAAARAMFVQLVKVGDWMTRADLGEASGYPDPGKSTYRNGLSQLRTLGLIEDDQTGQVRIAPELSEAIGW